MAKKKPAKRSSSRRAAPVVKQKETVRVKTFIVEKPVYIEHRPQRGPADRPYPAETDEYPAPVFDSKKSPYLKRRAQREVAKKQKELDEEVLGEGGEFEEQGLPEEEAAGGDAAAGEEEAPAGEEEPLEEGAEAEMGEEVSDGDYAQAAAEGPGVPLKHARSHGMFTNVWWKKAIIWAVLIWLVILGLEFGMQAMKLIEVDLTRQWWVLLGIIVAISLIYNKFFSGKIKI